jgi:two-component system, cell cycle response regulator
VVGDVLRVLLVETSAEDHARMQALLVEVKEFPTELIWETTYPAALERLKREAADVILVNGSLDGGTGLDFVREVQTRGYLMPVIILARQGEAKPDLTVLKAGTVDYLEKEQLTASLLGRSLRYAIQKAQLQLELRELAIHDELTGLYNRREFYRMLAEEYNRCRRYGRKMVLLKCGIDRLKAINEACGHVGGDGVLRQVAQALQKGLRAVDRLARYGGDEFVVILPETEGEATALKIAERLCRVIPSLVEAQLKAEGVILPKPVTLSIGIAELPGDANDPHMLVERVNQALYAAKCQGGNSAVSARQFRR